MENWNTILDFWFGGDPDDARVAKERESLWWSKNEETDAEIRRRFEHWVFAAQRGDLDDWRAEIGGRLALIILTDQFPRNIFRGTPLAFGFDEIARDLCLKGVATRSEKQLTPIRRVFFYLPLEHSENIEHQTQCVEFFRELAGDASGDLKSIFDGFVDFALRHKIIIERFGRFPHRNSILGRESTPEEVEFLSQPGSSF